MAKLTISEILKSKKFDGTQDVEPDKILLSVGMSIIGTAGNFITLSGLPKAGKSTFISAIVVSAVANKEIFDFRAFAWGKKTVVFDTEQTNFDFSRTIKRVKKLAKKADIFENLDCYLLRENSAYEILHLINQYLKENKDNVSIVIIDGILDCLNSFNDEAESKKLIRILKRWASQYNCLIITVLHTSKQSGNTLGHYGSMSDRYSQSTLSIEKTKNGSFICQPKLLRSAGDFEPIEIIYSETDKNFIKL